MNYSHCVLVLTLLAICGVCLSSAVGELQQKQKQPLAGLMNLGGLRGMVGLPKDLVDFEKYQRIFHKNYPSLIEKMARAKLYAVQAFKVFVSWVDFIWRRKTKFLVVNRWSDSTVAERRKFFNYGAGFNPDQMLSTKEAPEMSVKLEDIEHRDELGSGANEQQAARDSKQEDLKMDELVEEPSPVDGQQKSLPAEEAKEVVEESDNRWFKGALKSALTGAAAALAKYSPSPDRPDPMAGKKWIIHSNPRRDLNDTEDQIILDYNDSGCLAAIQDQGLCGCCYIMSTIALYEYHYCKQTKRLEQLSKQHAIDCGLERKRQSEDPSQVLLDGCSGGREDFVAWFLFSYGVQLESEYPFEGVDGQCPIPSAEMAKKEAKIVAEESKWTWLVPQKTSNEEIKFHLETVGPLTISSLLYDDFAFYGGGVDLLEDCHEGIAHSMLLIGYGVEDGLEYWLVRNSIGTDWGARGHWKLWTGAKRSCIMYIGYTAPKFALKDNRLEAGESS